LNQKRVVVLEGEQIFGAAVSSLLSDRHHLDVRAVRFSHDDFLAAVAEFAPEVIVVEEDVLINNLSTSVKMLRQNPGARMIVLDRTANTLKVLERQLIVIGNLDDFLDLV
jgi:hypothetical protein